LLKVYSESAIGTIERTEIQAHIWALGAAQQSHQAAKPVDGKLKGGMAALKRQVRLNIHWIRQAKQKAEYIP